MGTLPPIAQLLPRAGALAALTVGGLLLAGCGGDSAEDPSTADPHAEELPAGAVEIDTTVVGGESPTLCVGPIMESAPPQCSGPRITNWDWAELPEGSYVDHADAPWGEFSVSGTHDPDSGTFVLESVEPR
ncbi:hypothetical protein [Nesterenkonia flava]|uniref:Lipoprotein n=1 Tax=Nesterenkonia flava TaxID=469799 RepID=A0ABU1FT58_9MICC|nr:hypothetical protein [Nesterenkonia flava]MDR5711850.1 hypothetical protein [Nesterenkonia flava]